MRDRSAAGLGGRRFGASWGDSGIGFNRRRSLRTFPVRRPDTPDSVMNLESLNSQIVALRDGDEAVGCALTELDSRLESWLGALREGQTAVVDAWRQLAAARDAAGAVMESMRANETPAAADVTPTVEPEAAVIAEADSSAADEPRTALICEPPTPVAKEPPMPATAEAASVSEPSPEVGAMIEVADTRVNKPEAGSSGGMFRKSAVVPDEPTPVDEPPMSADGTRPGSPEDDEALLATLDEQTLAAIRVKRRLGGTRRSVRELLEEIQCEKPAVKDKPQQRKSWWR